MVEKIQEVKPEQKPKPKKVIAPTFDFGFENKNLGPGRTAMIEERLKNGLVSRRYSMVKPPATTKSTDNNTDIKKSEPDWQADWKPDWEPPKKISEEKAEIVTIVEEIKEEIVDTPKLQCPASSIDVKEEESVQEIIPEVTEAPPIAKIKLPDMTAEIGKQIIAI